MHQEQGSTPWNIAEQPKVQPQALLRQLSCRQHVHFPSLQCRSVYQFTVQICLPIPSADLSTNSQCRSVYQFPVQICVQCRLINQSTVHEHVPIYNTDLSAVQTFTVQTCVPYWHEIIPHPKISN